MKKKQNMDTDNFIVYIKTEDIYVDIGTDVQTRFDTSIYKLEGLLPREKNKKVVGLMKKELEENLSRKQSKPSGKKKIWCG